jgi:dephospho-CoA kinase
MIVIGITGTLGAGKGTVVEYLVNNKGFKHYSVSDYLKEILFRNNIDVNRTSLQDMGNNLRKRYGSNYITKKLFAKAIKEKSDAIIESIRNPSEARFIKENGGFLFAVNASPKIRYQRIKLRASEKDFVTFRQFREQEKKELENNDPNSQNLIACIKMADYKFNNNGAIKDLYDKVEKTIQKIG